MIPYPTFSLLFLGSKLDQKQYVTLVIIRFKEADRLQIPSRQIMQEILINIVISIAFRNVVEK